MHVSVVLRVSTARSCYVRSTNWSSTEQLARPATKRFHPSDWRALEACCRPWTWWCNDATTLAGYARMMMMMMKIDQLGTTVDSIRLADVERRRCRVTTAPRPAWKMWRSDICHPPTPGRQTVPYPMRSVDHRRPHIGAIGVS